MNIFIKYIHFVPSLLFMVSSLLDSTQISFCNNVFMIAAIAAIISLVLQLYNRIILDRMFLFLNIYLIILAIATELKMDCLQIGSMNNSIVYLSILFGVAIFTTFFTRAGFLGVEAIDEKTSRSSSYILLMQLVSIMIVMLIFHFCFITLSPIVYTLLPLFVFINGRTSLIRQLEQRKQLKVTY